MPFGQVVFGPPGSGKTTYCHGLKQFFSAIEQAAIDRRTSNGNDSKTPTTRNVHIVNLDPANDASKSLPYKASIDINDLISLEDIMRPVNENGGGGLGLGPNGGMIYCIEYLEENFDWLQTELTKLGRDAYVVFDLPGQVELYTHHGGMRRIVSKLQKSPLDMRLVGVHLCDSHYCTSPDKYVSVLLLSLQTMLQMGLPHVNVLSKMDLIEQYGRLDFRLGFYTRVLDLGRLVDLLNSEDQSPLTARWRGLNSALVELVEDFGLVSFKTLCVEDVKSVAALVREIDRVGGYVFASADESGVFASAMGAEYAYDEDEDAHERYVDFREEYKEYEAQLAADVEVAQIIENQGGKIGQEEI